MEIYSVWEGEGGAVAEAGNRQFPHEIEAFSADEAAEKYAEDDIDGNIDGIYTDEKGEPLWDLKKDGRLIIVEDAYGKVYRFRVGIVEYEPVYASVDAED